ncbi:thioredoxin family protein [Flavobacterium sp. RHBU_24]|uniref:thioredoxin family protein n=1 Tax=Flavobacterium sp. RHBU_24 TaxID=3391185 RepID=UPI003984DD21
MKLLLSLLLIASFTAIKWEPDFENAKKIAKENHKLILLNFSGSDWCGPCIQFRKEYLESEAFGKMADESLVLVNADFPRKKKNQPADDVIKRNEALAEKYNKEGNFPFTLLLDANGKVIKTWKGKPEESVDKYIEEVQAICANNK